MSKPLPNEIATIYADEKDRFIVSLIVGYTVEDLTAGDEDHVVGPEDAARWALDLTRDEGARGTHWFVYDRQEKQMFMYEQSEFDPEMAAYRE